MPRRETGTVQRFAIVCGTFSLLLYLPDSRPAGDIMHLRRTKEWKSD